MRQNAVKLQAGARPCLPRKRQCFKSSYRLDGRKTSAPAHRLVVILCLAVTAALQLLGVAHAHAMDIASAGQRSPEFRIDMLIDPSRKLTLEDVLSIDAQGGFKPLSGSGISLGYTDDAAWLKLSIKSDEEQQQLLSLTPNFTDLLDVYVARRAGALKFDDFIHMAMGDHRPVERGLSVFQNIVPLELRADETTLVYIRAAAVNSTLLLKAELYPPAEHTLRTSFQVLAYGTWFGGMAVLLVIQLVFYHFDRRSPYGLLALATFIAILAHLGTQGLSRVLLFPQGGNGNDYFTAMTAWGGLFASAIATASILELARDAPRLNRAFQWGACLGLVGIVFAAVDANIVFAPVGTIAIILLSTLAAYQGLRTANRDGIATRLRAVAFVVLWLGLVSTLAQTNGASPLLPWAAHAYGVSVLVQTVLLTGSLAARLRAAEARNREMAYDALAASQAAEQRANAMVTEKTRQLADAKQRAEEALQAELSSQEQQVRFMEVISHQYRTPLAAIRTHVDNTVFSLPKDDAANRARLERIRRGIARLVEVLEVNLSRSRLQGPSFRPSLVRASVGEIVEAAVRRGLDLLQHDIVVAMPPDVASVRIMADRDMLGIAIINLLENAVKFSKGFSEEPVTLACALVEGRLAISVSDKGIGIPERELDGILGQQVRGSNAKGLEGTGMGLSLVARIMAAHQGSVEIESQIGCGTTVRIILPAIPIRAEAVASHSA